MSHIQAVWWGKSCSSPHEKLRLALRRLTGEKTQIHTYCLLPTVYKEEEQGEMISHSSGIWGEIPGVTHLTNIASVIRIASEPLQLF